jgi:hypothetical protein
MSDLQIVVTGAKTIEKVLADELGGTGPGLYEKMASTRIPVPQSLQRRIRYVASMRNKNVHELRVAIGDHVAFTERCARIVEDLRDLHAGRQLTRTSLPATPGATKPWTWIWAVGGLVLFLVAGGVTFNLYGGMTPTPMQGSTSEPVAQSAARPAAEQSAATSTPSSAAPAAAAPSAAAAGAVATIEGAAPGAAPAAEAPAAAATSPSGYYGTALDALTINAVSLRYQANAPIIEATVRNTSSAPLSHALLDARLYLDGEAEPALINGKRTAIKEAPLTVSFGAGGLAAGETRNIRITPAAASDWSKPDIVKAKSRNLVLRVVDVIDRGKTPAAAPANKARAPR